MEKVKVYSTPNCPYCVMVKDFLKEHKVSFKEVDVSADQKEAEHMVKLSGQMGVPVTIIGKEVIIGFDAGKIKRALGL